MNIELSPHQLSLLIQYAAEMGAKTALASTGKIKPYLNQRQAFRNYGRANVEGWIALGLVTFRKDGDRSARCRLDRLELEAAAKSRLLLQIF
jgi:hypothetical protein